MKNLSMIVWITQLGLSVAIPPAMFILLAVWLRQQQNWGDWVIWAGIVLGVYSAIEGLRASLKAMERLAGDKNDKQPPVSFNEHQ